MTPEPSQITKMALHMFAQGATAILETKETEWDIWLSISTAPDYSINLFFNGEGKPQATLYSSTKDGIDSDSTIELF
jgi:hypothetical protein